MARNPKSRKKMTDPRTQSLQDKWNAAGTRVSHRAERKITNSSLGTNRNQAYTASGGANNQAYDRDSKQFTKATTATRSGRMAVEGSTRAGGMTWAQTVKDTEGNTVRQSGRSQLANRNQRGYDIKLGFNNMTPTVARAMFEAGQMTAGEYRRITGGGSRGLALSVG